MTIFVSMVHGEVEAYREIRLSPIRAQRAELLGNLDEAYVRVKEGNAVVTGYLSSVVKLTDEQNKLLAAAGLPDLQMTIAAKADDLSQQLDGLVQKVQDGKEKLQAAVDAGNALFESNHP
jgi:hypothetical protein